MLISQLEHELEELANFIGEADGAMERTSRENESCRRLLAVPGIGPDCNSAHRGDRKRSSVSQGSRVLGLGWHGAA
ncbi:hypothetical protein [Tunturibacter empetritectus]|nr:hypothetical protein [Edaphobacter lichenicola]